jgi:hypothetical protein
MVGVEEFHSCKINSSKKDNHLEHICDKPDSLHYYTAHFILNNTSVFPINHGKGWSIYILSKCLIFRSNLLMNCGSSTRVKEQPKVAQAMYFVYVGFRSW